MNLSTVCIKRPVLACVISLILIIGGVLAFMNLSVSYLPDYSDQTINIETVDSGASAVYIEQNITTPIEDTIGSVAGVSYIESSSIKGASSITATVSATADYDEVMNDIRTRVDLSLKKLPDSLDTSPVVKEGYRSTSLMRLAITDPDMSLQSLQDYVTRNVQDSLSQIEGVGDARAKGASPYAMLVTADPQKLTAYNISIQEITDAIKDSTSQLAAGTVSDNTVDFPLNLDTSLSTVPDFENVAVKNDNGTLVFVKDIAKVTLEGFDTDPMISKYNGKPAIIMEVNTTNDANEILTATLIKQFLTNIKPNLPPGMEITPFTDMSIFMNASVSEVYDAIIFAIICVVIVIVLFLGNLRAALIPIVTIPVCLISAFILMEAFGFSINMITLIAIVLSVGLVVDDAIVVVENIHRRIGLGDTPFVAAIKGSKEIVFAIVVMTLTLTAVYIPFGFMTGMAAAFLKPFAFTLAGAVLISGVISLTLSPMMCSRMLPVPKSIESVGFFSRLSMRWEKATEAVLDSLSRGYAVILRGLLKARIIIVLLTVLIAIFGVFIARSIPFTALPDEDLGMVMTMYHAAENADTTYINTVLEKIKGMVEDIPGVNSTLSIAQGNNVHGAPSFVILQLDPWADRASSASDIESQVNQKIKQSTGIYAVAHSLGGSKAGFNGIEFTLYGSLEYDQLYDAANNLIDQLSADNDNLTDMRSDIAYNTQEYNITINRVIAAKLNVSVSDIVDTIATLLGTKNVTDFNLSGFNYNAYVIAPASVRQKIDSIGNFTVKNASGISVPLSQVITLSPIITQATLPHYNRQHATTISAQLGSGYSLADAIAYLNKALPEFLPAGVSFTYTGDALDAVDSNTDTAFLFILSICFIYLILAAQFESFLDPLVVLFSVPLCIVTALLALKFSGGTINLYTTIGLITLIGLIAKHGILITQFANLELERGASIKDAVIEGASIRLRPILMTTAAMVVGALPLLLATGPGENSRHQIGLVIVAGMLGGTFFSLVVVPVAYSLLKQLKQWCMGSAVTRRLDDDIDSLMEK